MHTHLLRIILVVVGSWLILTGCDNPTARASAHSGASNLLDSLAASDAPSEVFDADALQGVGTGMVTIETDLPAQIDVVTFPFDEVGLDYMTWGWGGSDQQAAAEAHQNVSVSLERVAGGVLIWARPHTPAANPNDNVKLHVRIPRDASLVIKATKGGDVNVAGQVRSLHTHTPTGTITVKGIVGPLQLMTESGSINVDSFAVNQTEPAPRLELHARHGNIHIFGVGVSVLASTTQGDIRFVGSLYGYDNDFSTTGEGNVLLALPEDISYRMGVQSGGSVTSDFMPATLLCAMLPGTTSGLNAQLSPDTMGQIIASDLLITPTYSFESVMGRYQNPAEQLERSYLYFRTDHSQIMRFSPANDAQPNGRNAAQALWSPACETVKQQVDQNARPPTVSAHVKAERGAVKLRLIRKHEK